MSETTVVAVFGTRAEYVDAVDLALEAIRAYYKTAEPIMDDPTFDALMRSLEATEGKHPDWRVPHSPVGKVAGGALSGDVPHTVPCLSLDNVFSTDELLGWAATFIRRIGRSAGGYTVEPKMDGLAVCARYRGGRLERLITRGDGLAGEDVTFAAAAIVGLPATLSEAVDIEIRGEVILTHAQLEAANELRLAHGSDAFANARNGVSGALRGAKGRSYVIPMTFFAYQAVHLGTLFDGVRIDAMRHSEAMKIVERLGVQTTAQSSAGMAVVTDIGDAIAYVNDLAERRPDLGYDIDGAVIKADAPEDRDDAGFSSRAPRWGIAYKYPPDTAIATLEEVIWQVGRTGVVTPRARITPTFVGGTTITYATLHNPSDIARKGFMLRDQVSVHRAGEVIPRLEAPLVHLRTGAETPIEVPQVCPRCGGELDTSQARWRCVNSRACGLTEAIVYAVHRDTRLDIDGMGEKIIVQLVERKLVGDIADLFTLTKAQLLALDRMGETTADKLLEQIANAKSQPLHRVFCALNVRMTGRSMSRRLAKHFGTMDAILAASQAELEAVEGVGPERAATIIEELAELKPVIDKLVAAGVNMVEPGAEAAGDTQDVGDLPLRGVDGKPLSVVVSGKMSGPLAAYGRVEMEDLIRRAGGKDSGSVSKNTSFLVTTETTTGKAVKAASLGVPVLTPEEFAEKVAAFLQ